MKNESIFKISNVRIINFDVRIPDTIKAVSAKRFAVC